MTYSAVKRELTPDRRSDGRGRPFRVIRTLRHTLAGLLIAGALTAVLGVASASAAGSAVKSSPACWKVLINDWFDGRIDGVYAIHCYREALAKLPADIEAYSSARDDIRQALQRRIQGGGATDTTTTTTTPTGTGPNSSGGSNPPNDNNPDGPVPNAINNAGPNDATSVPVPLLVLGGVALVLMVAGAAGFVTRRNRLRRAQTASAASVPHGSGPDGPEQS
jgi:hypothetical protein